jgi:hypothetical protein
MLEHITRQTRQLRPRDGTTHRLKQTDSMTHLLVILRIAVCALVLGLVHPPLASAADAINVLENRVDYSFAQHATFILEASSDAEISQVYLFFQATGDEQAQSVNVEIEQAKEISEAYVQDLRFSPLPPFATVTFWWRIENVEGTKVTTEPKYFEYRDNRFQWEKLSANGITIHWIEERGDPVFAQAALDIAQATLREANAELRAPVPESIDIYIYDSQYNLEAAMVLAGREWVSGQAHPELGSIVIAIPPETGYTSRMKRYIPHEITHLLVYQDVTPAGYPYVPEWLDEGLATANEQLPTPEYALVLEEARTQGQLLPLKDLCVPFPPDSNTAFLSYAQSGSVVQFIREQYGAQGIRALLDAYANGASCASGVQDALNTSLSKLETTWRASLEPQTPWQALAEQASVWAGLWLLSLLVALPMLGGIRRRQENNGHVPTL